MFLGFKNIFEKFNADIFLTLMKSTVYQTVVRSYLETYPFRGQKVLAQIGRFNRAHNFHHF